MSSLPRQTLPHLPSNSPSKSSLRRTPGLGGPATPTTHFADAATQHHFLPHSPPNQTLDYENSDEEAVNEEIGSYPDTAAATGQVDPRALQQQIPQLQPFFTLIEDTATGEHYHPTIHYIFADDDTDIVTEAACRSLEQAKKSIDVDEDDQTARQPSHDEEQAEYQGVRLPPPTSGVAEHYLILDVEPTLVTNTSNPYITIHPSSTPNALISSTSTTTTAVPIDSSVAPRYAFKVHRATSLSPTWQILRTQITNAPTMGVAPSPTDDPAFHPGHDEGLMLKIEGRGTISAGEEGGPMDKEREGLEEMIERFQKRLGEVQVLMAQNQTQSQNQAERNQEGAIGLGLAGTETETEEGLDEQD